MIILGLTGPIAMGKSTVAKQFAQFGIPVFDADKVNHYIIENDDNVIRKIKEQFPEAVNNGRVNRKKLGEIVFNNKLELERLEAVLHPAVFNEAEKFIKKNRDKKAVLLDIPLLFETGWDKKCDYTIAVTAPYFIQKVRALKREGMTNDKFKKILANQKVHKTDFTINTGLGLWYSLKQVRNILKTIRVF